MNVTFEMVRSSPEIRTYITQADASLTALGFTEHSFAHVTKCAEVAANMTYLELSTYPGYMDSFVAACFLPHTDRSLFPHSIQER